MALIGSCGLDCANCEAYQATQANDEAWKERVAAQWRAEYHNPTFDVITVTCDGCRSVSGPWCSHCAECDVRSCTVARGVANCAECPDYACEKIEAFFNFVPQARKNLDALRN